LRTIIFANGLEPDPPELQRRLKAFEPQWIIAADGGARLARLLESQPDLLIGDQDSLPPDLHAWLEAGGTRFETAPRAKDETDLELALLHAAKQGADPIVVLAAAGGRLDMTLANICLLAHPGLNQTRVEIWHGRQRAWLIRPPGEEIRGRIGETLSLLPLSAQVVGVRTHGLAYPLMGETLIFGPARGISNQLQAERVHIELEHGLLLAVHEHKTKEKAS